jgi:hypothetical protein
MSESNGQAREANERTAWHGVEIVLRVEEKILISPSLQVELMHIFDEMDAKLYIRPGCGWTEVVKTGRPVAIGNSIIERIPDRWPTRSGVHLRITVPEGVMIRYVR